jgi:hypothetical protein
MLYNIHTGFIAHMKQVKIIKTCSNENNTKVKHASNLFLIQDILKQ